MEKRGADVYAIDIDSSEETGFNIAKQILDSKVKFTQESVYNLTKIFEKDFFDIVCFTGVYYHLKNPILALEKIADILKLKGKMLLSGELLISSVHDLSGNESHDKKFQEVFETNIPLSACYPGEMIYNGRPGEIYYVPNLACLKSWLKITGFNLETFDIHHNSKTKIGVNQRMTGVAQKIVKRKK